MRCARCGSVAIGRAGARWCACGWSEDSYVALAGAAVEEPSARRRIDLHARIGTRWSANELAYLYRHRDRLSCAALAAHLGRSPHAVEQKLSKAGLRKRRHGAPRAETKRARWSEEELAHVMFGSLISHRTRDAQRMKLRRAGEGGFRSCDGLMSSADVARAYLCPVSRVHRLRQRGRLVAVWRFGTWRFDPAEVERERHALEMPKQTWKDGTPDLGDYHRRRYVVVHRS